MYSEHLPLQELPKLDESEYDKDRKIEQLEKALKTMNSIIESQETKIL